MSFIEGMFRFRVDAALVEKNFYGTIQCKIPKHPHETPEQLVAKALIFALEQPKTLTWSGDILSINEAILTCGDKLGQVQCVIELACPPEKRVVQYGRNRTLEEAVIYFLSQEQLSRFLHYLKGSQTNWIEKFRCYLLAEDFISQIAKHLRTSNHWSLLLNENSLFLSFQDEEGIEVQHGMELNELDLWSEFQEFLQSAVLE